MANTWTRPKVLYDPNSEKPFRISRSKIDTYINCPFCFYLDLRFGVSQPKGPAFTLNSAVDTLLKKEFDLHRAQNKAHPLMEKYNVDAIPFTHPLLDNWRANFTGINFLHSQTNLEVFGAIDDVWITPDKKLHIVDYKATSKAGEIVLEDTRWHNQYKRQMEIYQWLFKQNKFDVSDTGYFVYVNGKKDRAAFDGKLEFDLKIIPYKGNDGWVEKALFDIKECLNSDEAPASGQLCDFCAYRRSVQSLGLKPQQTSILS